MNLSELLVGQKAVITHISQRDLLLKLFEMGVLPGEIVEIENVAPFGDPIAIKVGEYKLCLRISDAKSIEIKNLPE